MTPVPLAIVCGIDRRWRLDCAGGLRVAGYQVRMASTMAEFMKAIAASSEGLLIVDPTNGDARSHPWALHGRSGTSGLREFARAPDEAGAATAARVLAAVGRDQPTSSA